MSRRRGRRVRSLCRVALLTRGGAGAGAGAGRLARLLVAGLLRLASLACLAGLLSLACAVRWSRSRLTARLAAAGSTVRQSIIPWNRIARDRSNAPSRIARAHLRHIDTLCQTLVVKALLHNDRGGVRRRADAVGDLQPDVGASAQVDDPRERCCVLWRELGEWRRGGLPSWNDRDIERSFTVRP